MVTRATSIGLLNAGDPLTAAQINSVAAGWIGYAEKTSDQAGISSTQVDISSLTTTVTVNASRRLLISAYVDAGGSAVNDRFAVLIMDGATQLQSSVLYVPFADAAITTMSFTPMTVETPTAGAHTYKLVAVRNNGSGTMTIQASAANPGMLLVQDIGAA
jgi:hypothetical protein